MTDIAVGDQVRIINPKMKWAFGKIGVVIGVHHKQNRIGVEFAGMYTPSWAESKFAFELGEWEKVD